WDTFAGIIAGPAGGAHRFGSIGRAAIGAIGHDRNLRQQPRQAAHSGRLRGAFLATDKYSADTWVDCVQNQRALQAFLTYQGAEWINWSCFRHRTYFHAPKDPRPNVGRRMSDAAMLCANRGLCVETDTDTNTWCNRQQTIFPNNAPDCAIVA